MRGSPFVFVSIVIGPLWQSIQRRNFARIAARISIMFIKAGGKAILQHRKNDRYNILRKISVFAIILNIMNGAAIFDIGDKVVWPLPE